ncbi:MAG: TonB-dependent receptor [Acidobacteria bacterium]|nr:TonB-dependent receptor [Acidobacteriota bacterium]MBI3663295.1 TonB-dependent receptor [Acidobacteriota bacterium]
MGLTLSCWREFRVVVCLAVLGLMLAPMADAQSQGTGQIVGTVYDASGAMVPGAKVTVTGKATGLMREAETNQDGGYRVLLLPPGPYTVEVKHQGFKGFKTDVTVSVGSAVTVDARLQVGQVTEVVEVTATAIIETTAVQTDALINLRSISDLPINGRRFHDFVQLTPTAQIEPSRQGISFAGQRGINANITIDGADYNQPFFGGIRGGERSNAAFSIPQEAIQEFQIVAYGATAEFGRTSSGTMNAVTKSGTNEWHGSGFYLVRHKDMARKDAFNRQSLDSQHLFGGSFGGPVRKDKSFFFVTAEQQKINNPRLVIFRRLDAPFVRTAANGEAFDFYRGLEKPFAQTNDATSVLGKWDEQLNANHRVSVRYLWSTNTAKNAVATGTQISPETSNSLENNGTEGDRQHTVVGNWTAIFSPRLINEFRGQYSWEKRPRLANANLAGIGNTVGNTGTRSFLSTTQKDYRIQIADNMTWSSGRHAVKFGGEFNYLFADQFFQFNQFGIFSVSGSNVDTVLNILSLDPANPNDRRFDNSAVSYRVNIGNGLAKMKMQEFALFIQDQWRIHPRFTLTAGFRWEGYWNPSPDTSNTTLTNAVRTATLPFGTQDPAKIPDNLKQFMPRLGIAWDPWGNAKTVIRLNGGIYFARTPLLLFAGPLNNFRTPAGDLSVQLPFALPTGYVCTPLYVGDACTTVYSQLLHGGINLNSSSLANLPILTPAILATIAGPTGLNIPFDPNQGVAPITMANNYESPRSWQWNIAVEQEVLRGLSVGADFVYINTVHLERNRDWNIPAPVVPATDLSLRQCFGLRGGTPCSTRARPIPTLNSVQVRETNSRALYRGATLRASYRRKNYQFQAYYTISKNYSDDDNERDAGGLSYENAFNLQREYGYSNLDARHLFVFNSVVELPWDFAVSGLVKLRSGRPLDPSTGSDSNGDFGGPDRPLVLPGVPFARNSFRDRASYAADLRVAKKFKLPKEGMFINLTVDFFNLFDFDNVVFGSSRKIYGVGTSATTGAAVAPSSTFMQLYSPSSCLTPTNPTGNKSCYDTQNTVNTIGTGGPFQMQVGIRFQF